MHPPRPVDIGLMSEPAHDFDLDLEQALTVERLDASNRTLRMALPFTTVAVVLVEAAFGNSVPWPRKLAWAAIMFSSLVIALGISFVYERKRREGPVLRWRAGLVSSAVVGLAWGSLVLVAFPPAEEGALRAFILVFAVGVSSVTLLSTASSRGRFFAVNLPMAGILAVVYLSSDDHTTRFLGYSVPLYVAVMTVVHRQVHQIVMSNMRLKHELRDAAMHDGLTGVLNRRAFTEVLDGAVAQARRSGELIGVLYLDVDQFKSVNDRFGHAGGDELLVEVARRLRKVLRRGDTCGRLGGDEFALLARGLGNVSDLTRIGERVLATMSEPFELCGNLVSVAASVGASAIDGDSDAATLLREADAAQYRAKRAGGQRSVAFDQSMRHELQRDAALEADLEEALAAGRIVAHFQPLVNLRSGETIGMEALARWVEPSGRIVPAAEFLGAASRAGLLEELDLGVVRAAMEARVKLRDAPLPPEFRVWINVDGHRIAPGGRDRLAQLLEATGCEPYELGIEITEREVLRDVDGAVSLLRDARAAGVRIALDDFGTGHSSLVLLRRLPLDVVKVDRSFVAGVADNPNDRAIVASIVRAGLDLGLQVYAEGVETEGQADVVRDLGCEAAQGFLIARALPLDEMRAFLTRRAQAPAF
jgi:diguanylate cyclase (GGDEF)-like protein